MPLLSSRTEASSGSASGSGGSGGESCSGGESLGGGVGGSVRSAWMGSGGRRAATVDGDGCGCGCGGLMMGASCIVAVVVAVAVAGVVAGGVVVALVMGDVMAVATSVWVRAFSGFVTSGKRYFCMSSSPSASDSEGSTLSLVLTTLLRSLSKSGSMVRAGTLPPVDWGMRGVRVGVDWPGLAVHAVPRRSMSRLRALRNSSRRRSRSCSMRPTSTVGLVVEWVSAGWLRNFMRANRPGETFRASLVVLSRCGGVGRRDLGDDAAGDGADDGLGGVFAGRSTVVAGLLLLFTRGGAAGWLIEHFSAWTSRRSPGRVQSRARAAHAGGALDARMRCTGR